jgi:prepilin-type N-terminal cleavage/methylation domain-containing protein
MNRPARHHPGFTLTELLVAIAIVATLGGIVFAIGKPMIARSRQAACLNQLRSIGTALEGHLQDHNQMLPTLAAGRSSKTEDVPVLDTLLKPYLENEDAFHCPQDRVEFSKSGSSYLWNSTQNGKHITKLEFFTISDRPDRIPLVTDKEAWHPAGTNFLYADRSSSSQVRFASGN